MKKLMSGNEAIARGAYEAGVKFAAAYPGTPSTEILENVVQYKEIHAQWAPNEKVALEVAVGAALGGVRSLSTMKHVGLNVAADPLFSSSYMGVNAGLVIVTADDPSMHSSQNEQDNRWYARAAKIPMLEPSDSQDAKDFVKSAFEISEKYDTPVLLRTTTRINHSKTVVEFLERKEIPRKTYEKNFAKNVVLPANARKRHVLVEKRMVDLEDWNNTSPLNRIEWGDKKTGIITSGVAYQHAKEVFPEASFLKIGLTHPLPKQLIQDFAAKVDNLLVIEELDPVMEEQIRAMGIQVTGKEKVPQLYELNPNILNTAFDKEQNVTDIQTGDIPVRPPVLCPGCSHRGIFWALNRLKVTVTGDIGCYTLGALAPLSAIDTCLDMGASVSMAEGLEKADPEKFRGKLVAVIGDSTFIHSGITGLIDIVYNKTFSKVIILDNHITAMTGHQDNPSTGLTLEGTDTTQLDFVKLCEAVGIKRIVKLDPYNLKETLAKIKAELAVDEPSVMIAEAPCIIHARRKFSEPYWVDTDKCIKCGMCFKVGCPAIEKDKNGKTKINPLLCIGCDMCLQMCKPGAIQAPKA